MYRCFICRLALRSAETVFAWPPAAPALKQGRLCGLAAPHCWVAHVTGCAAGGFWFCSGMSKVSERVRAVRLAGGGME